MTVEIVRPITITIQDNRAYCDEHNLNAFQEWPCFCVSGFTLVTSGEPAKPDCVLCSGSAVYVHKTVPFELQISPRMFNAIWGAAGLDATLGATVYPRKLVAALSTIGETIPVRYGSKSQFVQFMKRPAIGPILEKLALIYDEAIRREELVVWVNSQW